MPMKKLHSTYLDLILYVMNCRGIVKCSVLQMAGWSDSTEQFKEKMNPWSEWNCATVWYMLRFFLLYNLGEDHERIGNQEVVS